MDEFEGRDLDRATEEAWRGFRARLADHVGELGEGGVLVLGAGRPLGEADDGASPYVRLAGFAGGSMLRGEVSGNAYLAPRHALDDRAEALLVDLGWRAPGDESENFFLDVPVSHADQLAVMAVRALREVFGVAHPAFLEADLTDPDDDVTQLPVAEDDGAVDPPAVVPEDVEHLRALVDAALTPLFGDLPEHDADGDIPVPFGSSLVYVRVVEEAPVIDIFGVVVDGVSDLRRASYEVNVLNRDHRFVKFFLVEDRVIAQTLVAAWPFAADHLRMMLTGMSAKLDQVGDELAARVGGRTALGDDPDDEPASRATACTVVCDPETALRTLLQLDAASGGLDAELAAGVCGFDQEVVLGALDECLAQEAGWRESREAAHHRGDQREARACARELAAWGRTTALLRRALRLVVERAIGRGPEGLTHGDERPATGSPRRPATRRPTPSRHSGEEL